MNSKYKGKFPIKEEILRHLSNNIELKQETDLVELLGVNKKFATSISELHESMRDWKLVPKIEQLILGALILEVNEIIKETDINLKEENLRRFKEIIETFLEDDTKILLWKKANDSNINIEVEKNPILWEEAFDPKIIDDIVRNPASRIAKWETFDPKIIDDIVRNPVSWDEAVDPNLIGNVKRKRIGK